MFLVITYFTKDKVKYYVHDFLLFPFPPSLKDNDKNQNSYIISTYLKFITDPYEESHDGSNNPTFV